MSHPYYHHNPISIHNLSLSFPHKTCFQNFSTQIPPSSRIALIGNNGSGKSSLLQIIHGSLPPSSGHLHLPKNAHLAYIPQIITSSPSLSGAQRFNAALSHALSLNPNILLLDEPTNHLDLSNRSSLLRMLQSFPGSILFASHDLSLINALASTLWHLDDSQIHISTASYHDYSHEYHQKRSSLLSQLHSLKSSQKALHLKLMRDQERAKKRRLQGEKKYHGDKLALRAAQGKGQLTTAKNRATINSQKSSISSQLQELHIPPTPSPNFFLPSPILHSHPVLSVHNASCGYTNNTILHNLSFSIGPRDRIALLGNNASGKSTLLKALINHPSISKSGSWLLPPPHHIAYLDQHYAPLPHSLSVLNATHQLVPNWPLHQVRKHLNDFLFQKNPQVHAPISSLSGGEKARLSLALLALSTPKLLILDEITNNLDLPSLSHIITILNAFPAALLLVSHDPHFLSQLNLSHSFTLHNHSLSTSPNFKFAPPPLPPYSTP